jgi:hypothetical protein
MLASVLLEYGSEKQKRHWRATRNSTALLDLAAP